MNIKTLLLSSLFLLGYYLPVNGQFCPTNIGFESGTTADWIYYKGTVSGTATTGPFYTFATTTTPTTANWFGLTSGAGTDNYGGFPVVSPGGGSYSMKIGHDTNNYCAERALYNVEIPSGTTTYSLVYHYAVVLENPTGGGHTANQLPRLVVSAADSASGSAISCISYTYVASSTLPGFVHSTVTSHIATNGTDVYYKPWTAGNMKFAGENGRTVAIEFTASDCTEGAHFGYGYIDMSCGLFASSILSCGSSTITVSAPAGYSSYHWYDSATFTTSYATTETATISVPSVTTTYAVICTPYSGYGCTDTLYTAITPTALVTAPSDDTAICAGASVTLSSNATDVSLPLTYSWTPSTGLSCTTCGTVTATPSVTTTYSVTTTDAGGCLQTNPITVTVYPTPAVITGSANACIGSTNLLSDAITGGRWTSSSTGIATIGSVSGVVGGVSSGITTITYSFGSGMCATSTTVNVNPLPSLITGTAGVCAGLTTVLADATTPGTWSSSSTSVATVGLASGVVGGVLSSTSVITYTASTGCTRAVVVTVNPLPSVISGTTSVCAGATTGLTDGGGGTWSSGSTSIATVITGTGVVRGVSTGTSIITYTLPTTCITATTVTVNTAPAAISGSLSVCVGALNPLTDATTGGTWTSSNTGVATISGSGLVGGVIPATSTITYTAPGGCQASAVVTVNGLPGGISGPSGLCAGTTTVMSDVGTGSWSSSNPSLATVIPGTGMVTGVAPLGGTDTIIYTLSTGCAASAPLSIYPMPSAITGTAVTCVGTTAALGDTSLSGTWSSSNPGVATVDFFAGTVLGVSSGTAVITYTIPSTCFITSIATINPLPLTITGLNTVCSGATISLLDGGGGTWTSSDPATASVDPVSGIVTGGVIASVGSVTITYTLPTGCSATDGINIYPPPGPITGAFNICVGQSAFLADGAGGTWVASNANATVNLTLGILSGVSPGTDVITYTNSAGCTTNVTITVNSTPGAIAGVLTVCAGSTTVLSDAGGGTWVSSSPGAATATLATGTITGVAAGTSNITYSLGGTCVSTATVTVSALPALSAVTGGGSYCAGGVGLQIYCGPTVSGLSYQLYLAGVPVGSTVTGTGGTIDFGLMTSSGSYTVVATNTGAGCSRSMTGSATITGNPAPTIYAVTGGGSYCTGGSGVHVMLSASDPGIHYQVFFGSSPIGTPVAGTGSSLDFGLFTGAGTYTVVATNITTGCTSVMIGSAAISISPLPVPFIVTGGGAYCAGGTGVHITLNGSTTGISYQLYNGPAASGVPLAGTGSSLDFGLHTAVGTYTVIGTSASTLCSGPMTGSVVVTINPTPSISGPTAVCAGATIMETVPGFTGGTWTSGSTAVATVGASTGFVGGISSGSSATITYTAATGCAAMAVINVSSSPGSILGTSSVCLGSSAIETDAVTGGTWVSGSTSIATVGSLSGTVSGAALGSFTITYSLGTGCTVTKSMTVTPAPSVISGSTGLCVGTTTTLTDATSGGTWSSSSTGVASVTLGTGIVYGVSSGTAVITYTAGGCAATMIVSVNTTPVAITGPVTVCAGLTMTALDAITGGTWASSSTIATVSPALGIVTGATPGTATITYSLGAGCSVNEIITVTNAPAPITGAAGLCLGATESLVETTTGGTWSCIPPGITTVGSTGIVTGLAIGTSTILYNLGGCTASLLMTVNPAPGLITGATSVCAGSYVPFSDPVSSGAWTSSNTSVATVSTGGSVWGASSGTATISYSLGGSCVVTKNISVNPISPITGSTGICVGATTSLNDATTGGAWSSSSSGVATVSSLGIVGGILSGPSTITYTTPAGCTAATVVNVNTAPSVITGAMSVCQASSTSLADGIIDGSWSSGSAIATIDPVNGTVYGVLPGTATITYSLGFGCIRTAVVTVNPLPAAITGLMHICSGASTSLGDAATGGTWSSAATSVTVNVITGNISGVSPGMSTITYALATGCSVATVVTVNPLPTPVTGTEIACAGTTTTLSAGITGGVWTSSNTTIAITDPVSGVVTGVVPGTATMTYALSTGCAAAAMVTITAAPDPIVGATSMCVGSGTNLIEPPGAGIWSSSNTGIALVSGTGIVSGLTLGTSTISYTYSGCTATIIVTVNSLPGAIVGINSICVGTGTPLTDLPYGGTWSTASPAVATIDPVEGIMTGISSGTALITYSLGIGCSVSSMVTINALPAPIAGISQVCFGSTTTLSDTTRGGTWSSSDAASAPVSSEGIVSGLLGGPATISYTNSNGCVATRLVTVVAVPPILGLSEVCAFTATAHVYDSIPAGTWTSSEATISTTGVISAFAAGPATVTYTIPLGCFTETSFTIHPQPGPVTGATHFCIGITTDLADTASGGVWSSSNTLVAPVDPSGAVTGMAAGTAVISYALATGCMQTDTLTVYPHPSAVLGAENVCVGSSAILSDAVAGGTWSSSHPAIAGIGISTGSVAGLFPGVTTVTYSLGLACYVSAAVTVNPQPDVYTVTGGGSYCAGAAGVHIGLGGSQSGVNYQLYLGALSVGSVAGSGSAPDFGLETSAGTYTVIAVDAATACTDMMTGSAAISIIPAIVPSISMLAVTGDTTCQGYPSIFTATAVNGGPSPVYQWMVNGTPVGTGTSSYSYVPANDDVVSVQLTSDTTCALPADTMSNTVTMTVDAPLPLVVNITALPNLAVNPGENITLTASVVNGSPNLIYQWVENNIPIPGATSSSYADNNFYNGDSLTCIVVSNGICSTTGYGDVVFASPPNNEGVQPLSLQGNLTVLPNPSKGEFVVKGTIGTGSADDEVSLEITDMLGQVVYKDKVMAQNGIINDKISLSNTVANGMYILSIRSGSENSVFHIVIEQ